jgi:hypothetical protein
LFVFWPSLFASLVIVPTIDLLFIFSFMKIFSKNKRSCH